MAEQFGNSDTSTANDSIPSDGENIKPQFSLKAYSEAEKKGHVKSAKEFFGETNNWNETEYITTDGTKLDFSGRHEGAPGGQTGRRGDGQGGGAGRENLHFNPRPREGGDLQLVMLSPLKTLFQSTPPARGATYKALEQAGHRTDFNPRPPRGGRQQRCTVLPADL